MCIHAAALLAMTMFALTAHADGVWSKFLNGNDIIDLQVSGSTVWCATDGGLVRWEEDYRSPTQYTMDDGLDSNQLSLLELDREARPWISYERNEHRSTVTTFDGYDWVNYRRTDTGLPDAKVHAVYFDRNSDMWLGTVWGGIYRQSGSAWQTYRPELVFDKAPRAIIADSNGDIWLATSEGAWRFAGGVWSNYTQADGLASSNVNDIDIGADGVVWFATNGGVTSFDGTAWTTYTKNDGLVSNMVTSVTIDFNGTKWFGADYGLTRFGDDGWSTFTGRNELVDDKVTDVVLDDSGNLWIVHSAAGKGVTHYNGADWLWYTIWNTGLPSNTVSAVTANGNGEVWFATDKGIVLFDGSSWTIYTLLDGLPSTEISQLYTDGSGVLWIAYGRYGRRGVTRFDGETFQTYTVNDGLDSDSILSIAEYGGTMYFGSTVGLTIYDGATWINYPNRDRLISPNIFDIVQDNSGVMWFGTSKGISRFDGVGWYTYYTGDPIMDDVVDMEVGPDGTVWGRSSFGTIMRVADDQLVRLNIEHEDIPENSDPRFSAFTIDENGVIWATLNEGTRFDETMNIHTARLWSYDGSLWRCNLLTTEQPFDEVRALDTGSHGEIWMATDSGLRRFRDFTLETFLVDGPIDNNISAIAIDGRNGKTVATERGLSFYDGTSWENLPGTTRRDMRYDRNGTLWLADSFGILTRNGTEWTRYEEIDGEEVYRSIAFETDKDGVMWIGTVTGLWKHADGDWTYYGEDKGGVVDSIRDIAVDRNGIVWMTVGLNNGVWSFDGETFKKFSSVDGLSYDRATQIAVDHHNRKWIGTLRGLSCYNDSTWTSYFVKDGLPSDNITAVAVDNNGIVWVGTDKGAVRIDGSHWQTITVANGLVDDSVINITVDKNNVVWIGTTYGLSSYDSRDAGVGDDTPAAIRLYGSYPNPFNIETVIDFDLQVWGDVVIDIYNIAGQKVRTFRFGDMPAGRKNILWNARDDQGATVSSGPYFYRIVKGGHSSGGKMMLVK